MIEVIDENSGNEGLIMPDTYEKTLTSNNKALEVVIRANISAEKATEYPVFILKPMDITNEYAAKMMNALFGDKVLYARPCYGGDFTAGKDWLGYMIKGLQAKYDATESKISKKQIKEQIEAYQAMYADAPETMYTVPALKTFSSIFDQEALLGLEKDWQDGNITNEADYRRQKEAYENAINNNANTLGIYGIVDLGNGRQGQLKIIKSKDNRNNSVQYQIENFEKFNTTPLTLSEADAISMANQLLSDMGIDFMGLGEIKKVEDQLKSEYQLSFYRELNGTKAAGLHGPDSGSIEYRARWNQEVIYIQINNNGIGYFSWKSPSEMVETKTDRVKLLGFNEIMNIFEQQILINQAYTSEDTQYVTKRQSIIEKITLSTMTVPQPDNQNEYISIPVWDFEGYQVITYSDDYQNYVKDHGGYRLDEHNQRIVKTEGLSILTVNAIDGSIIDRALGY